MEKKITSGIMLTLLLIGVLLTSLEMRETSASPAVRIYVEMPAQGYISGIPVNQTLKVAVYIESPPEWNNTADGIVAWGFSVRVDPEVLEPITVNGAASGYFLYDFASEHGYLTLHIFPTDKEAGLFKDLVEAIEGFSTLGVGAGGNGKLCELWFKSKSQTAYTSIDIYDAKYTTSAKVQTFPVDIVEDGHYASAPVITTGTLNGTVTDASTSSPIAGATIIVDGKSAITDVLGHYEITLDSGAYDVSAEMTGYATQIVNGVVIIQDATTTQDFALNMSANAPPHIDSYSPLTLTPQVNEGDSLAFTQTSSDPDGDHLTYSWLLDSITQSTAQSWMYYPDLTAAGSHNVTLVVSDGFLADSKQWNVTVINVTLTTVESCDSIGMQKHVFYINEDVYVKGSGFSPNYDVKIYVIPNDKETLPDNAVANSTATINSNGLIPVTRLWSPPLTLGKYDIWVDANMNGIFDSDDFLNKATISVVTVFIVPEPAIITFTIVMFGALGIFYIAKKRRLHQAPHTRARSA